MLSFDVGTEEARRVCNSVRLMALARPWRCRDRISHPATITTPPCPPPARPSASPKLVRISAGIEDPQDLIEDIRQALG